MGVVAASVVPSAADMELPPPSIADTATGGVTQATNFHLVLHQVYKNPPDATIEQLRLLQVSGAACPACSAVHCMAGTGAVGCDAGKMA